MRREIFVILLILGGIFLFSSTQVAAEECATSTNWSGVKINEFSTYTTNADWVELFNIFDNCTDLGGLSLFDSGSAMKNFVQPTNISAQGYLVVDVNNRLNRDQDSVVLKNEDTELDRVDYGTGLMPAAGEDEYWMKSVGDTWVLSRSSTPGFANFFVSAEDENNETPTTTNNGEIVWDKFAWAQLQINEMMIDPSESEEEWVELYNAATTSIDLTGGVLCDSRVNNCEIAVSTSTISAGGYIILSWNSSKLNNDTDKVIWKNPAGEVVDQVQYGIGEIPVASDGYSLARNAENNWVVTTVPTLGAENIIQAPLLPASSGSGSGGVPNSGASIGVETKNKTTKTVTSTVKIKEDPVKVVWKVKVPTQGAPYEALLFDASDSADPRGGLLEILWNFGDGVSNFGDKVPHSYVTSGIYFVTVSATSSVGTIGEKKFTLHIASDLSTQNTEVKISEVLANPIGADKREFIRLYNASSSTVDLSGWRLSYKEKEYIFPVKTKMPSGSFLTFYQAVTHFTLENSGGQIELFTPNDELADVMNYDKAIEGVSSAASSTVLIADKKVTKIPPLTQSVKNTIGKKALRTVGKTLAEVRTVEKNTAVQVQGTVAVLPGVFGVQYFYITNDLGGIQIYQHKKLFPLMKIGDIVLVKGVTSASGDMQRVKVSQQSDITVLSSGTVSSTLLALEDLAEDQLGRLVRIAGEITEIKSNFMYVDDGTTETVVYFKKGAKIDKKQFKEGELVEVEGILEKSRTGLQIWPRGQGDIVITGQSEDLLSKESVGVANGVTDTASKYLTATAGGITTLLLGFFAKVRGAAVRNLAQKGLTLTLGLIKKNRA